MYYPDLSIYTGNLNLKHNFTILQVGWLEENHPFQQGETSDEFKSRLEIFCLNPPWMTLGFHHTCSLCKPSLYPSSRMFIDRAGKVELGSSEIAVPGSNNILYLAPDLIYHYVNHHDYQPPIKFITAIIESPLPGSLEYKDIIEIIPTNTKISLEGRFEIGQNIIQPNTMPLGHEFYFYQGKLLTQDSGIMLLSIWGKIIEAIGGVEAINNQVVVVMGEFHFFEDKKFLDVQSLKLKEQFHHLQLGLR